MLPSIEIPKVSIPSCEASRRVCISRSRSWDTILEMVAGDSHDDRISVLQGYCFNGENIHCTRNF